MLVNGLSKKRQSVGRPASRSVAAPLYGYHRSMATIANCSFLFQPAPAGPLLVMTILKGTADFSVWVSPIRDRCHMQTPRTWRVLLYARIVARRYLTAPKSSPADPRESAGGFLPE